MIEEEISQLQGFLPRKVIDASLEYGILTLSLDGLVISVRCPFKFTDNNSVTDSESDNMDEKILTIGGSSLDAVSLIDRIYYPDLLLNFSNGNQIRAYPERGGDEMWYIDVPEKLFISP